MSRYKFELGQKVVVRNTPQYAKQYLGLVGEVVKRGRGIYTIIYPKEGRQRFLHFETRHLAAHDEPEFNGNI